MMRKKCPKCNKNLRYNFITKEHHCPIEKINMEKKYGCGYTWKPMSRILPMMTKEDKEKVLKSLGGFK